jgi:PadR family transcriptional regulator PadR
LIEKTPDKKFRKELNAGTAALVLLGVLEKSGEPMYGYQIAKLISSRDDSAPMMKQGALYPVLRSLERGGLLESTIETSVSGPPRRYYRITAAGRDTLARWIEMWKGSRDFIDSIIRGVQDA